MKTQPKIETVSRHSGTCLPLLTLLSLVLVSPLLGDDSAPQKDYALFVGATLQVEDGPGFFEIVGAKGNSVSLLADGKLHNIRSGAIRNVRIERNLRLSDVVAQIDKMTVTPTCVASNANRFEEMHMQILMSDMAVHAQDKATNGAANIAAYSATEAAFYKATDGPPPAFLLALQAPNVAALNASISVQSTANSFGPAANTGNNALDIECELSMPRVTPNTYALVLTEFRESTGGKSSYNLHVEPIGELGPKPKQVSFTQDGLPFGFILGRVDIHLYASDKELATNLSEQRVDLTTDDAMRYLVLCYVANHAKDSLAATPLFIPLPADFKGRTSGTDFARTVYAKIGKDGTVHGVSAERDHLVAINPYLDSTVRKFRFNPALKDGKPVESQVELRMASLMN